MGNTYHWLKVDTAFANQQDLLQQLIPIEQHQHHNSMLALGTFQIYRFKTEPYEIIMKHVRIFSPNNAKYVQYAEIAKAITSLIDHKNIARIHSINICTNANICMKQISIESYVNYYAINMEQVINKRKKRDIRLTSNELWYLVNSLSQVSFYLKSLNLFFGVYLAKNIYLSSQGYIKIYLYHLHPQNKHLLYYHIINSDIAEITRFLPVPPECLSYLKIKAQELLNINIEKIEVFGIAMIALQSMFLHSTKRYYENNSNVNQYSFSFNYSLLQEDIAALKQVYPQNLLYLLQNMTKPNPQERFGLQDIKKYIKDIRNDICISGSIKIIEDEENPILPKISYRSREDESHSILKSITTNGESRLQFRPMRAANKQLKKYDNICQRQTQVAVSLRSSRLGMSLTCATKQNNLKLKNVDMLHQKGKYHSTNRTSLNSQR